MVRLLKITSLLIAATVVASAQVTLPFAMFHETPATGGLVRESYASQFGTGATNTLSVTIPNKPNLLLVVKFHWVWSLLTDITFNGSSITQLNYRSNGGYASTIWYLVNPTPGTYNLVSTVNFASDNLLAYEVYSGADQSQPFTDDLDYWEGTASPIANSLSCAVGDSLIDVATFDRSSFQSATVYSGQGQFYNNTTSGDAGFVSSHKAADDVYVEMGWTLSAGATWSHVAASVRKAP